MADSGPRAEGLASDWRCTSTRLWAPPRTQTSWGLCRCSCSWPVGGTSPAAPPSPTFFLSHSHPSEPQQKPAKRRKAVWTLQASAPGRPSGRRREQRVRRLSLHSGNSPVLLPTGHRKDRSRCHRGRTPRPAESVPSSRAQNTEGAPRPPVLLGLNTPS